MNRFGDSYHIGNIIKEIREEQHVQRVDVCQGLCHEITLTRIEAGEEEPGKWLADTLLERLGTSPGKFDCLFTWEEEMAYRCRVKLLYELRQEGNGKSLAFEAELQRVEEEVRSWKKPFNTNQRCQQQFLCFVRLVKHYYQKNLDFQSFSEQERLAQRSIAEAEEVQTIEALRWTIPDLEVEKLGRFRLGRIEWALVTLLADLRTQRKETREQGLFLYREILDQLQIQMVDEELIRECYPYVMAMLVRRLTEQRDSSGRWLCQKGMEQLRRWGRLYGLEALLEYELQCAKQEEKTESKASETEQSGWIEERKKEELGWRRIALQALRDTRKQYKRQQDSFPFYLAKLAEGMIRGSGQGEQIRRLRLGRGMTQKDLCNGICSRGTLSRIEKGRQIPQSYTFQKLLEALGQKGIRYIPFVFSNQYQMHKCYKKVAALISEGEYGEAGFELTRLERGLRQEGVEEEAQNKQLLMRLRALIEERNGKISLEERLMRLEEALDLTIPSGTPIEEWPLSQSEIVLLNNIANTKEKLGDRQGAIEILEAARKSCESCRNGVEWNKEGYMLILYNLSRYLGNVGRYEEEAELIEKGIELACEMEKEQFFRVFLYKKAWNIEEKYKLAGVMDEEMCTIWHTRKNTCLKLHRQAFSLAYLFKKTNSMIKIRNRCFNEYGIQIGLEE